MQMSLPNGKNSSLSAFELKVLVRNGGSKSGSWADHDIGGHAGEGVINLNSVSDVIWSKNSVSRLDEGTRQTPARVAGSGSIMCILLLLPSFFSLESSLMLPPASYLCWDYPISDYHK